MSFDDERHDGRVTVTEHAATSCRDLNGSRGQDRGRRGTHWRGERAERSATDWREVDRQLRRIARRRAAIDAEEAPWLLAAHRGAVHAELGHATFVEYVEHVLGYGPRVALDRLRVAEALEMLPATRAALAVGDTSYSAVRELTRVATPATEGAWLAAAAGKTVRDVEAMVCGHRPGDLPDDPTDPDLRPRVLRFEIAPETFALFREAERRLAIELGHMLSDDELIAALCQAVLVPTWAPKSGTNTSEDTQLVEAGASSASGDEGAARSSEDDAASDPVARESADVPATIAARGRGAPLYQVAVTVCSECQRGWQDGAGQPIEIGPAAIERAMCDAQVIGDVNAPSSSATRAARTIPPATRRKVLRRDHGRCIVPGCRSTRIDVHHLVPRARGGSHAATNLAAVCQAHHTWVHAGRLVITGEVGALKFHHADGRAWGAALPERQDRPAAAHAVESRQAERRQAERRQAESRQAESRQAAGQDERRQREALVRGALRKLGWSAGEAAGAVERACAHVDEGAPIEAWIVAALRACRRAT